MLDVLEKMADDLNAVVRGLVVEQLSGADATALLRASAAVERRAAVLKTLVAKRAVDSNTWTAGYRSPEDWLGEQLGAGFGSARATLGASEKLGELPGLDEAARNGELSSEQLNEIADVATPENEESLLGAARNGNTNELRRKCRQEKSKARSNDDVAARAERAHRTRYFNEWIDNEGAWRYEGKGTAADGARFRARLAAETEQVFKEARRRGEREAHKAYRHDALMRLVFGSAVSEGKGGGEVVVRVDASRLAGDDGICEMSSFEVPVDEAIGAILSRYFIKVVLTNGVDVTKVAHVGRHIPAELKTAIQERDGYRCVHCGSTHRLEVHHYRVAFADGGLTAYWNLGTTCKYCRANDVQVIGDGNYLVTLIGYQSDLDAVEMLFASLVIQATRAMFAASYTVAGNRVRAFRHSFLIAFAHHVEQRLEEARTRVEEEVETETGMALVPLLDAKRDAVAELVAEEFPHVRMRRASMSHAGGYLAGRTAAENADIGQRGRVGGGTDRALTR